MNDKDKEALKEWKRTNSRYEARSSYEKETLDFCWQAACEYKQKEIDKDKILILELSVENAYYFDLIAKLQAENTKLRECIEWIGDMPEVGEASGYARQVLKELGDK